MGEEVYKTQEENTVKGLARTQRQGRIKNLSSTVIPKQGVSGNGSYVEASINEMQGIDDRLVAIGRDFENMSNLEKGLYRIIDRVGISSSNKRVTKMQREITKEVLGLEAIAQKGRNKLYHKRNGLYTNLSKQEIKRDQAVELVDLLRAERTDLQMEKNSLVAKYTNKEYGPGQEYASPGDIREQIRKIDRALTDNSTIETASNIEVLASHSDVKGLKKDVAKSRAIVESIEDKSYQIRKALVRYRNSTKVMDQVKAVRKILNKDLRTKIDDFMEACDQTDDVSEDMFQQWIGVGDYEVPETETEDEDDSSIVENNNKRMDKRRQDVDLVMSEIEEEAFVY